MLDTAVDLDPSTFLGRLIYRYYGTYSLDEAAKQEEDRQEANDPDWQPSGKHPRAGSPPGTNEPSIKAPATTIITKTKHAPLWSSLVQAVQDRCIVRSNSMVSPDMYPSIVTRQQMETLDAQVASLLVIGERLQLRFPAIQPSINHLLTNFVAYVSSLWSLKIKTLDKDSPSRSLSIIYNTVKQFTQDPKIVQQRVASMEAVVLCPPVPVGNLSAENKTPPILFGEYSIYSFAREYGLDPSKFIRRSPSQIAQIRNRCQSRVNTIIE